jgi:hypothetical protein
VKEYHWGRSVEEGKVSRENREGKKYKYGIMGEERRYY